MRPELRKIRGARVACHLADVKGVGAAHRPPQAQKPPQFTSKRTADLEEGGS